MTIRTMQDTDLDQVALLFDQYRVFYEQDSDLAEAKSFISARHTAQDSKIFIALDDTNQVMGFTQLYPSFSSVGMSRIWILNDLYVYADHRMKGVGKNLMNYARDFCKSSNRKKLILETGVDNHSAQSLYHKLGYKRDEVYSYYLGV